MRKAGFSPRSGILCSLVLCCLIRLGLRHADVPSPPVCIHFLLVPVSYSPGTRGLGLESFIHLLAQLSEGRVEFISVLLLRLAQPGLEALSLTENNAIASSPVSQLLALAPEGSYFKISHIMPLLCSEPSIAPTALRAKVEALPVAFKDSSSPCPHILPLSPWPTALQPHWPRAVPQCPRPQVGLRSCALAIPPPGVSTNMFMWLTPSFFTSSVSLSPDLHCPVHSPLVFLSHEASQLRHAVNGEYAPDFKDLIHRK